MFNAADSTSLTESNRIAALRSLALLDTPPSETFDRVTRLVAKIIDVPIAMVSLVDETRQWFKSRVGLEAEETRRDISMCTHVVAQRRPMLIPDTTLDARFATSPLVTGSPHIRAYAGVPLFTVEGHAVGTLCALDQRPRQFSQDDIDALTDLAQILEDAIQSRELAAHTEHVMQFAQDRERLFRDTFDMAAAGIVHVALSGKLMRVNQCVCEMLGYTAAELERFSVIDLTHPEDIIRAADAFHRATTGTVDRYHIDKRLQRKDRSYVWCHLSVSAKRSVYGATEYMIAVIEDIAVKHQAADDLAATRDALLKEVADQAQRIHLGSDSLRSHVKNLLLSEQSVRRMEQRLRAIANSVPAMIGYWNRNLECEFANETYREWFGLAPENIVGMTLKDLLGDLFEATAPYVRLALEGRDQRFDRRHVKQDGTESYLDVRYIPDLDAAGGEVRGFFVLVTDQTASRQVQQALQAANAQLTNDSVTDAMTGLANRAVFHLRGEDAVKHFKKRQEVYGLILIDLGSLRLIDESYGHEQSDKLLRTVAGMLKTQLRNHRDIAARLGNEEFAILCFGALDDELLLHIAKAIDADLTSLQLTASFGMTISRDPDTDWKRSYSIAETALRDAKRQSKNRIVVGRVPEGAVTP